MVQAQHPSYRFADTLRRLLRRNAGPNLRKILDRAHPADIAAVLDHFVTSEQLRLLTFTGDYEDQAEVVAAMPIDKAAGLLGDMPLERAVSIIREMSGDDRADLFGEMDEALSARILAAMPDEESDEVAELLRYDEATAGGIMSPDVLAIPDDVSAAEAIHIVQQSPDVEMAFYLYVVNDHDSLVGVLSLRQLVTSRPEALIKEIMNPQVVSVTTDVDQEEVARLVSRYDFLAVPVVDATNTLVGVVTVDDVIDVIKEEATEDILKMAGAGEAYNESSTIFGSARRRAPWLFAALVGGMIASLIISRFEETLARYLPLAAFIPVIIGMAGNVGTQSLAITVRGLATRRIEVKHFWRVIGVEILVALMLGVLYGAALGGLGFFHFYHSVGANALLLAAGVGSASALAMLIAAVVATAMPMLFAKLHIDPAVATGPFVTTAVDILGVVIYFNIVTIIV
jgi:magnesium transporter